MLALIITIIIFIVLIYLVFKLAKVGAKIIAVAAAFILLAMAISIIFSSHISKLNCYYYVGVYENKCVSILNNISSSMSSGESRSDYNSQLSELDTYLYYSKYSLDDMKCFKDSKEKKYTILQNTYNQLNNQNITANEVVTVIDSSLKELRDSNE